MGSDRTWLDKVALAKDTVKSAIDLAQKSNDMPLLEKLYEARSLVLDLQDQIQELREKVTVLENINELKTKLSFKRNSYWKKIDDKAEDGPYCSTCFDSNSKLIRLIKNFESKYVCNYCKNHIDLEPDRYRGDDHANTNRFGLY